jgi:hypothetical protein
MSIQVRVVFEEYSEQVPDFSLIPSYGLTLARDCRRGMLPVGAVEYWRSTWNRIRFTGVRFDAYSRSICDA